MAISSLFFHRICNYPLMIFLVLIYYVLLLTFGCVVGILMSSNRAVKHPLPGISHASKPCLL